MRHSALFVWADGTTDEQKVRVKDGVAYCYYGSEVLTLDFGEDLGLYPSAHGFTLMHDHRDRAAWDAYNENGAHARVGAFLKSITQPELAARVDWDLRRAAVAARRRPAPRALPLERIGRRATSGQTARAAAAELARRCPTVRALELGLDLGWYPTNYDWIVEAHFDDVDGLVAFMEHPAQQEAAAAIAAVTQAELTARVQHRMLAG